MQKNHIAGREFRLEKLHFSSSVFENVKFISILMKMGRILQHYKRGFCKKEKQKPSINYFIVSINYHYERGRSQHYKRGFCPQKPSQSTCESIITMEGAHLPSFNAGICRFPFNVIYEFPPNIPSLSSLTYWQAVLCLPYPADCYLFPLCFSFLIA